MNQDIEQSIEENLAQNGFHVSTTSGYSMYPMLRDRRDRVVILPTDGKRLKRYDLPLYKKPNGKYVLHRILRVKKDHYVIRGDNTYRLERIPFDWVIGYVDEFYRKGKHVSVSSRAYRLYASFWHFIYPVRWIYRMSRIALARVFRIFKKKNP